MSWLFSLFQLIAKAREYLGLSDLEKHTQGGGVLEVHIGDVFSSSVTIPGGYAGIIVDLFSDGKVLPQLEEVTTWLEMNKMLMPNGRLMVNCGAATKELSDTSEMMQPDIPKRDDPLKLNATINALCKAFPEQVSWKKLPKSAGENYLALTGPLPDLDIWSAHLPDLLRSSVKEWRSCTPSPS
uniref:S-adenosylmethionine-dependent methyltransferase n=1 Tax=Solanum tuberosum TaxID=4113 RepID=M1A591_SOLTU